ncbi:MAG: branched-chain amino acid ABC transporter substrate-binding protein [Nocardioides sp.]|uniref:branched-chain amino acid ABC transporter substrate-binding protein n=1 Tax=Nocardioides sp. TaxID=35761 RepID=UPI0039E715D3
MKHPHTLARLAAATAATALALSACGTTEDTKSEGGETAKCGNYNLAFLGATTGDYGALGQNMVGGIKLALDEYNKDHSDCEVGLKEFDSQGNPEKATPLATQIVGDDSIVGLIGPGFSGESLATGKTFFAAGLPSISPSATNVTITQQGWTTWHRVIGNDSAQGAAAARYITDTAGASKVFVVDDGSDYGKGLASFVTDGLGDAVVGSDTVQTGQTDFSATVTKVTAANADALFYGGYYAEAGLLVKQLRQAGYKGLFMSGDGSEDPAFVKAAGAQAAEGAILTAPAGPAPADFNEKYKAVNGSDSGLYSTQSYDAANIFLDGLKDGKTSHEDLNEFVNSYTGDGVSGPIEFDEHGDITSSVIFAYEVKNGELDVDNPTAID